MTMFDNDDSEPTPLNWHDDRVSEALNVLIDMGIVSDYAGEYGEPGYEVGEGQLVLMGDWWCRDKACSMATKDDRKNFHAVDECRPELFDLFRHCEYEWHDEWIVDHYHDKAYRTQPNSYSWQPSFLWGDGDIITPDDDIEVWIDACVNNADMALPNYLDVVSDESLLAAGFRELECGYESGWYGVEDSPRQILDNIHENMGNDVEVLFKLSKVEQFRVTWCVFVRDNNEED